MAKRKLRSGVHVLSTTPANYRAFCQLVTNIGCAERTEHADGRPGWTILNERKWSGCLDACETRED